MKSPVLHKEILRSNRIILREMLESDIENLHRMDSNPNVMRYIRDGSIRSKEESHKNLSTMIAYYEQHPGLGIWAALDMTTNRFVGFALLVPLDGTEDIQIGYRLLEEEWGKGYATECTQALLHYAFAQLHLRRVVAIAIPENIASLHVLEKAGMKYEKNFEYYGKQNSLYAIEMVNS